MRSGALTQSSDICGHTVQSRHYRGGEPQRSLKFLPTPLPFFGPNYLFEKFMKTAETRPGVSAYAMITVIPSSGTSWQLLEALTRNASPIKLLRLLSLSSLEGGHNLRPPRRDWGLDWQGAECSLLRLPGGFLASADLGLPRIGLLRLILATPVDNDNRGDRRQCRKHRFILVPKCRPATKCSLSVRIALHVIFARSLLGCSTIIPINSVSLYSQNKKIQSDII
jgi:hypothetical protein